MKASSVKSQIGLEVSQLKEEEMVIINGSRKPEIAGVGLSQYLSDEGYDQNIIAVECNGGIISKQDYDHKTILDGEIIEIVSFAGGG